MRAIKIFFGILLLLCGFDFNYEKPRRVFTAGFVRFCVVVAFVELLILHTIYYGPTR
jgi:hypothetical protein